MKHNELQPCRIMGRGQRSPVRVVSCNVTPEISAVMEKSEAARMFALISSVNAVASIRFEEEWRCVSSVSLFLCRKAKAC